MEITTTQACEFLSVSRSTLDRIAREDEDFPLKNHRARYKMQELLRWLQQRADSSSCEEKIPVSMESELVSPVAAAGITSYTTDTLTRYRRSCDDEGPSKGPPFVVLKRGLVRYEATSLAEWLRRTHPHMGNFVASRKT